MRFFLSFFLRTAGDYKSTTWFLRPKLIHMLWNNILNRYCEGSLLLKTKSVPNKSVISSFTHFDSFVSCNGSILDWDTSSVRASVKQHRVQWVYYSVNLHISSGAEWQEVRERQSTALQTARLQQALWALINISVIHPLLHMLNINDVHGSITQQCDLITTKQLILYNNGTVIQDVDEFLHQNRFGEI